jgi:N-acetyl-anhydromuramoyl-L-alanine amidase
MKIDPTNHLLSTACYRPSPHWDERPEQTIVDMIVIHGISLPPGEFGGGSVEKFFCNELDFSRHPYFDSIKELRVSSHLFIDRQGQLTQFVPFSKRAWHAGLSFFEGRSQCNDFSIGIELEGTDEVAYEEAQYDQLARTIQVLAQFYPAIVRKRIVGHSDIAPGRKTDPGLHFNWEYLDCLLRK